MLRKLLGPLAVVVAVAGAASCGGPADGDEAAAGCPDGSTRRSSTEGLSTGRPVDSREAAIKVELENLEKKAPADAISAGIVASSPASDGAENVDVATSSGVVTMTLVPQMPGWRVERSTWCAPS